MLVRIIIVPREAEIFIKPSNDVGILSRMYRELAEDEKSDSPQTDMQYAQCMKGFLNRGDRAYLFMAGEKAVGYALIITDRKPLYLRHFYICRGERRKGYGSTAFHKLLHKLNTNDIDLDVFVWNERGIGFWTSLGFKPRAHLMRLESIIPSS